MRTYDIDGLDNRDPAHVDRALHIVERFMRFWHRAEVRGVERYPEGPALVVGNHNGGLWTPDTFLVAGAIYRAHGLDAVPYGIGHEVVIDLPLFNQLLIPLGVLRASHENAHRLFAAGRKVMVYPGGDEDSMRPYRHRNRIVFGGRQGYIRLALREGVPIVPVVAAGAHSVFVVLDDLKWLARLIRADKWMRMKVWPAVLSFPWGVTIGLPPPFVPLPSKILIEMLAPIRFDRSGPEAADDDAYVAECDERVRTAMQSALDRLAAERKA